VFLSDNPNVARTYADPRRAWDYQGAEPEVFRAMTSPERVLDIDAKGADFRGISVDAVKSGLIKAGIPESEVSARISAAAARRNDNRISTNDLIDIVRGLGFDAADIANVRDTYNATAKAPKSTVRMMFNPSQINIPNLAPSLPAPRTDAEAMARDILQLRAEGRADEVTDDMMAAADPQYMYSNTPLPMDYASRMARAEAMGKTADAYHATSNDFSYFIPSEFRGASFFGPTPEGAQRGASASANEGLGSGSNSTIPVKIDTSRVEGIGSYSRADQNAFRSKLEDRIYSEEEVDALMASDEAPLRGNWSYFFDDLTDYEALRKFRDENPDAPIREGIIAYRPKKQLSYGPSLSSVNARDISGRQFAHYSEGMSERPISEYVQSQGNTGFSMLDESGLALGITDPTTVRSRFARFDPAFANLRNLSAGVAAGVPIGLLSMQPNEEQY
jgi:hypothetical protein